MISACSEHIGAFYAGNEWFLSLDAGGAETGSSQGYTQLLAGDGLSNGSGLVYQANLGIGVHLSDSLELLGTVGQLKAANGDLDAHVFGLSLGYSFRILSLD